MARKIVLWLLWIGFIIYILFFAPPIHEVRGGSVGSRRSISNWQETLTLLQRFLTFQWGEINPVIFSLFSLIEVWILIYSCLLFFDGRMQLIPFYPFALAAIATGIIGLLPYLALREDNREFTGAKDAWLQLLDSRWSGIFLLLFTFVLLVYGIGFGDWGEFWQQFLGDRFINGMSLAFCLFSLLFPTILGDDLSRRGYLSDSLLFWVIALVPLFGPLAYLCWRPLLKMRTA